MKIIIFVGLIGLISACGSSTSNTLAPGGLSASVVSCSSSNDCSFGQSCNKKTNICVATLGFACESNGDCSDGFSCVPVAMFESMNSTLNLDPQLNCTTDNSNCQGICLGNNGQSCTYSGDCLSGSCAQAQGSCAPGQYCLTTDDCVFGQQCNSNFCSAN